MPKTSLQHSIAKLRLHRTRVKLAQNIELPRLSVHRSLRHVYAQVIDDKTGRTLVATNDITLKLDGTKSDSATKVGTEIAKLAKSQKISAVRFDRGGRKYHGRIAAVAEAARAAGLTF